MSNKIPLRNDHYVYLLGAGYSAARGLPLIYNFLNRMRDAAIWCESTGRHREASAIHEVLKFRLDAAAAAYRVPIDLENIEELFSLASAADPRITDSVKLSIAATLSFCLSSFPEPCLHFSSRDNSAKDFLAHALALDAADSTSRQIPLYDAFATRLLQVRQPNRTSIITFNYDSLLETSIERIGGTFHYGLSTKHEHEIGPAYDPSGVAILKLHGSVNWADPGAKGRRFTVYRDYQSLSEQNLIPQIVPPTWNKTIADRLGEVWFQAIQQLSTATKIIVIGFSMPRTDLHFKYLLAAGMKDNFSLREIVFIDPSEGIKDRAAEVIAGREISNGRVRFIGSKLEDLIAKPEHYGSRYLYSDVGGRGF